MTSAEVFRPPNFPDQSYSPFCWNVFRYLSFFLGHFTFGPPQAPLFVNKLQVPSPPFFLWAFGSVLPALHVSSGSSHLVGPLSCAATLTGKRFPPRAIPLWIFVTTLVISGFQKWQYVPLCFFSHPSSPRQNRARVFGSVQFSFWVTLFPVPFFL